MCQVEARDKIIVIQGQIVMTSPRDYSLILEIQHGETSLLLKSLGYNLQGDLELIGWKAHKST